MTIPSSTPLAMNLKDRGCKSKDPGSVLFSRGNSTNSSGSCRTRWSAGVAAVTETATGKEREVTRLRAGRGTRTDRTKVIPSAGCRVQLSQYPSGKCDVRAADVCTFTHVRRNAWNFSGMLH